MSDNQVLDTIRERRSVREFIDRDVPSELLDKLLFAGTWAPSGFNNQPWRFFIVKEAKKKEALSKLTSYGRILLSAPVCIAVFMDSHASYHRIKDAMAIGACSQNILLAAHSLGLGGVWLGEILKSKEAVKELLGAPEPYELMAVLAIGYPTKKKRTSKRSDASDVTFFNY